MVLVVTLIAMKREVAVFLLYKIWRERQVFRGANVKLENWRQVTVQLDILRKRFIASAGDVVFSCRNVYEDMTCPDKCTVTTCSAVMSRHWENPRSVNVCKKRKGGGFFYGNKGNENYTESI